MYIYFLSLLRYRYLWIYWTLSLFCSFFHSAHPDNQFSSHAAVKFLHESCRNFPWNSPRHLG